MRRTNHFWTRTNIVLLAIVVEHLIIGLKIVIAILIPDVPKDVEDSEAKRSDYEELAKIQLKKTKKKQGFSDIKDIVIEQEIQAKDLNGPSLNASAANDHLQIVNDDKPQSQTIAEQLKKRLALDTGDKLSKEALKKAFKD